MISFWEWLQEQLQGIDDPDSQMPTSDPKEDEQVVGVVSEEDVKKLYALSQLLFEQHQELHEKSRESGECKKGRNHQPLTCSACSLSRNLAMMGIRQDAVEAVLWASVLGDLSDDAKVRIYENGGGWHIRKNWLVVTCPPEQEIHTHFSPLPWCS